MEYFSTKDPNIIKQIATVESEIHLDKLENQVADLEKTNYEFLQYPRDASLSMRQAVDDYNEPMIATQMQDGELLEEKKELLSKCKAAK